MWPGLTENGGGLRVLDERQRAVVRLFRRIDRSVLQLVLLQDPVQLVQHPHPLAPVALAVCQEQDGAFIAGR